MANVVVITEEDSAPAERIEAVRRAAGALAPAARGGTAFDEVLEGL